MLAMARQLRRVFIAAARSIHSKFYCCYILSCSPHLSCLPCDR